MYVLKFKDRRNYITINFATQIPSYLSGNPNKLKLVKVT